MTAERIVQLRPYPNFKLHALPENERDEAGSIRVNIGSLHSRAKSFWAGKMLFQDCAERQLFDFTNQAVYREWQLCAARDCVMSIYHFGRILEGIDESLGSCPTLISTIDGSAKREARKFFEQKFPAYITLRNAISHSAERSKTVRDGHRHGKVTSRTVEVNPVISIRVSEDARVLLVHDNVWGSTFTSMWNGKLARCEINDQTGIWLDEIVDAYWDAFDRIIDPNPEPQPEIIVTPKPSPNLG